VSVAERLREIIGSLPVQGAMGDQGYQRVLDLTAEAERLLAELEKPLEAVYAVTVSPNMSDDPIRWLFKDEWDADAFAEAINGPDNPLPDATVTYEPIAYTLDNEHLHETYPEETEEARRLVRA